MTTRSGKTTMLKRILKALVPAAALGLYLAPCVDLRGGDQPSVGVVRISDHGTTTSGAPMMVNGQPCDTCDGGYGCQPGHSCHLPVGAMLHPHGVTHSPDHGFRRPVLEHIQRAPVEYQRYWPSKWYGEPGSGLTGSYPMVYTPTDTTQLGFYYQRVPQWRPNPGMIPPRPWPSQWHRREVCNGCDNGMYTETIMSSPEAAPAPAEPQQPAVPPLPAEAPQASVN